MKVIEIQEEKYVKRIGYIQLLDGKKLRKIFDENTLAKLFDYNFMDPATRRRMFERLGVVQQKAIFENITPTIGFTQIAKALSGQLDSLDKLEVQVFALGTDDGTLVPIGNGNTVLGAETFRKLVTSKSYQNNKALYTVFLPAGTATGTFNEMALFTDADETITDDGIMYDRTLYTFTKGAGQDITFDYEDTYTNG